MRFNNKVAIVTGGTTGIGKETCTKLSREGAIVYNLDINEIKNNKINFIKCDVSSYTEIQNAVQKICKKEKKINLLFANAGIHLFANIEETSIEEFERILSVNAKGVFYILKEVIPIMKKQKEGNIILMGSDQSIIGKGRSSIYGMTKGAIAQLTKSTAIDYAEYNIKINCICPGTIETPLLNKAVEDFNNSTGINKEKILKLLKEAQPIKRIAEPLEVANVVCFLLSDENSFMTGSLVSVDGGYTSQ
ncbi:MAG: SDR family oxidoreductase [Alphaproteobacteria bacterium]|nr:SDR family oxidoreductase [Alphaproteobacteria bacterium]